MLLRGIEFGPCWDGPGIRGFFGEGFWYHRIFPLSYWLNFTGSTFVSKTTTETPRFAHDPPRDGGMPIKNQYPWGPREWIPSSIWSNPFSKRTVNAVGLSGPGAEELFVHGLLHEQPGRAPFFLSFMSLAQSSEERVAEFKSFIKRLMRHRVESPRTTFGLQVNLTCPNTGHNPAIIMRDALPMLDAALPLIEAGIPIVPKINVLAHLDAVCAIADHPHCDAICVSNTIPFNDLPRDIKASFRHGSPLPRRNQKYGPGGYSGPELLPLVAAFIRSAKWEGVTKPWNAGGGIRSAKDVVSLVGKAGLQRGYDSIFFTSAVITNPWAVPGIIQQAHRSLG